MQTVARPLWAYSAWTAVVCNATYNTSLCTRRSHWNSLRNPGLAMNSRQEIEAANRQPILSLLPHQQFEPRGQADGALKP
jgi:hypothetical protein